jgi:hypothetical protein
MPNKKGESVSPPPISNAEYACLRGCDDGVVDVDVVAEDADAEEAELDGRAFVGGEGNEVVVLYWL